MRVKREEQKYLRQITNKCFLGQGNFKKEKDCVRWKPSSVTNKSDSEDAVTDERRVGTAKETTEESSCAQIAVYSNSNIGMSCPYLLTQRLYFGIILFLIFLILLTVNLIFHYKDIAVD